MCATLAGTPSLSARRKSISRYARLCPPPWWRAVTLPWTLRPPRPCSGRTSDFSGWSRVTSAKSATLEPRRPGVVGLYLRIAMGRESLSVLSGPVGGHERLGVRTPEDLDALARGEGDDGALGVLALAHHAALAALALALTVDRVHAEDLHLEDLLDRDLDLRLVRLRQHDERVLVGVQQAVALLGDHRGEQDVPGVADAHAFSSVVSSAAASVAGAFFAAAFLAGFSALSASALAAVAFFAGAFLAAAFLAGASAAVPVSTVPSPSAGATDGMPPGIRWGSRSGLRRPLPLAGPATYSASAVSVKTTSSAISTS